VVGNAFLYTTTTNIEAGVLFQNVNSARVYRCPTDKSTVKNQSGQLRTRSYSANYYLNAKFNTGQGIDEVNTDQVMGRKYSSLPRPGPSRIYVFADEHEATMDDGALCLTPNPWGTYKSKYESSPFWNTLPADWHDNGCNVSFADGHVTRWRWQWKRTIQRSPNPIVARTPVNAQDRADYQVVVQAMPGAS
jgi:prepilin-type processing-associated H-X9-DG protein